MKTIHRYLALCFLACFLSACGRKLPEPEVLIRKSTIIYVAEAQGQDYYVKEILKEPSGAKAFSLRQQVVLYRQKLEPRRKDHELVVVFFDRLGKDENNRDRFFQTEVPLYDGNRLAIYDMPYATLLSLIQTDSQHRSN